MTVLEEILEYKIVAILRGIHPDHVLEIAGALQQGGVRLLEITLNSPDALPMITRVSAALGDRLCVGAGTVLDAKQAQSAIDAGARFIISPSLDAETIQQTRQMGAVSIPGAFTATEILAAWRYGADIVKVFPASVGVAYFRDLRGPLPFIPLMPTGGISLDNIGDFKKAGAVAFGIGSALVRSEGRLSDEYLQQLQGKAAEFVKAVTDQ
jgi:2-dehydro-3-deoxyphosphogluconate aldolase / (4S)-4-hydroxy-2-oxoglutarate aldolase